MSRPDPFTNAPKMRTEFDKEAGRSGGGSGGADRSPGDRSLTPKQKTTQHRHDFNYHASRTKARTTQAAEKGKGSKEQPNPKLDLEPSQAELKAAAQKRLRKARQPEFARERGNTLG